MTEEKPKVSQAVEQNIQEAIQLSEHLLSHPELPYEEVESSRAMVEILEKAGFKVEYPFMGKTLGYGTAFKAVFENGAGPSIAIMAEYDALPGIGHGCGHNLHGAMSVLAGVSLAELKDSFSGTIYMIGTPAEEENGAKVVMAQQGVFDDMSLAIMIHSWSGGVSQPNMDILSMRCYEVEFYGRESHAVAAPWYGRSALAAARKFLDLVDARRECFTPDIFVNSIIQNGGDAPNIIPGYAKLRMEFRTDSIAKLELMDETVKKCARGAAMALDCEVSFKKGLLDFWDMVRVKPLEEEIKEIFLEFGETVGDVIPASGSSDVGNVSYCCPTIQPLISICDEPYALHTEEMRDATRGEKAYEALRRGAEGIISLGLKVMNDSEFRELVTDAFNMEKAKKSS